MVAQLRGITFDVPDAVLMRLRVNKMITCPSNYAVAIIALNDVSRHLGFCDSDHYCEALRDIGEGVLDEEKRQEWIIETADDWPCTDSLHGHNLEEQDY